MRKEIIRLTIKQPGLFINIPGIAPFRTPGETYIDSGKLNNVISELLKNGVTQYTISYNKNEEFLKNTTKDYIIKKVEKDKKTEILNEPENFECEILDKISEQGESIKKIELILNDFLKSVKKEIHKNNFDGETEKPFKDKKRKSKVDDELIDDFIPSININNTKTNVKTTNTKSDINYEDFGEHLKSVTKKGVL